MAKAENTVIIDGQKYNPGDTLPDFKSITCVDTREPRKYQGLSRDISVLNEIIAEYASGGASCFMSDTGEYYEYDREEKTWKLITNITERGFDSEKAYGALKHMFENVVSDDKIKSAVTDYLTLNPVLSGATAEQAQQIEQNKTDVASLKKETGSLKEDLDNYQDVNNNRFEHENIDNGSTIKNSTIDYNNGNAISPGFGVQVKTDAPILSVSTKIKASASDNLICSILKDDTVVCFDSKPVTTNLSELVFEFPRNYVNGVVTIRLKTENNSNISYSVRGNGYTSDIMPEYNGQYLFEQYNNKGWSQVYSATNTMLLYVKSRKTFTVKESVSKAIKQEKNVNYIFVATSGNDAAGDGTEENPYATIYKANETITDSSETNKYEIIVKQGTYTDLQEKYSGVDGNSYQGVVCKPYVTYRSENILKPDLCVLKWDGADGYTKPVTDANCVNKCLFHIPTNSKGIYIKGFTFESKNTRYCMHIETTGSTDECDWHFENCVFNWGGRPDTTEDGTVATACIGTGYSMLEFGEFINCIIKCTNANHANHMVFQSHDNPDNIFTSIKRGEHLRFENCYFSIADGSDYAHIDLRTTKTSPIIPSFAEFINCSGIKLYVPSETYKKSFVCTEQHTIN